MAGRTSSSASLGGAAADGMKKDVGPKRRRGMCVIKDEPGYHPPLIPDLPDGATHEKVMDQQHRRVRTKYSRSFP